MEAIKLQDQLDKNRRTVAFDSYDITVRQLHDMVEEGIIDVAPEYQRHFIWNSDRQSQLIESLFLGIPVPSLFMATNRDSTWEVVDGLQRLTTIVNFIGNQDTIRKINEDGKKLKLTSLEKLDEFNEFSFDDLPKSIQLMFLTRPIRITVLNDRSDYGIRFDLFERLNTGGVILHPQEIRNCIYTGKFNDFIKDCAKNEDFKSILKLGKNAEKNGNLEELVLKFFAYYEDRQKFSHSVKGFLNEYMERKTNAFKNKTELQKLFEDTFRLLARHLPDGIVRAQRKNTTPIVLFETIALGVADALIAKQPIDPVKLKALLDDPKLTPLTTVATNSRKKLLERISYVKDHV